MNANLQDNPAGNVEVGARYKSEGPVHWVRVMGSKWGNDNNGGFFFAQKTMPSDVDYFIVKPMDMGLELFLTLTMTAVANSLLLVVEYEKGILTNEDKYEGEVVSIAIDYHQA